MPGSVHSCHHSVRQIGFPVPEVGFISWTSGRIVSIQKLGCNNVKVKVKESLKRPSLARRVPGG